MSAQRDPGAEGELYTVDELAAVTGMTVRTTRYYAGPRAAARPVAARPDGLLHRRSTGPGST